MARELHRILLTGPPGCGKTTAVMTIVGALHGAKVAGLYTEEIREAGPAIDPQIATADLFAVDEIGKMECFSERFVQTVRRLFASEACVLATVALKGGGLIQEVKSYPTVKLIYLTATNRDEIIKQVAQMLAAAMERGTGAKTVVGQAATLPEHPENDHKGLRMEILRPCQVPAFLLRIPQPCVEIR